MKAQPWSTARRDARSDGGFTLIELLVVVLILGILAAIVAFAVGAFTSTSVAVSCDSDAKSVETAATAYEASNHGQYPSSVALLADTPGAGDTGGPYLRTKLGNSGYYTIGLDASGDVTVQLSPNDPASKLYGYTVTGTTSAVNWGSWKFAAPGAGQQPGLSGKAICSGA